VSDLCPIFLSISTSVLLICMISLICCNRPNSKCRRGTSTRAPV
jgi:hypothetical protein